MTAEKAMKQSAASSNRNSPLQLLNVPFYILVIMNASVQLFLRLV
jgi:hypothetical protein